MARIADLPLKYRLFMRTYRLRVAPLAPAVALPVPRPQARLAVITTAGLYSPHQPPFDEGMKGGDPGSRSIPSDADLGTLRIGHRSAAWDHRGVAQDPELVLPFGLLRQRVAGGSLGSLASRHYSFQGSITAPGRLVNQTGPAVVRQLVADGVHAALLTPV